MVAGSPSTLLQQRWPRMGLSSSGEGKEMRLCGEGADEGRSGQVEWCDETGTYPADPAFNPRRGGGGQAEEG